jgi:hypothetical protein
MEVLALFEDQLTGSIPAQLGSLTRLRPSSTRVVTRNTPQIRSSIDEST